MYPMNFALKQRRILLSLDVLPSAYILPEKGKKLVQTFIIKQEYGKIFTFLRNELTKLHLNQSYKTKYVKSCENFWESRIDLCTFFI